jgi:hypothetical protein
VSQATEDEYGAEEAIHALASLAGDPRGVELSSNFVTIRATVLQLRHYFEVLLDTLAVDEAVDAADVADRSFVAQLLTEDARARIRAETDKQIDEMTTASVDLGFSAARVAEIDPAVVAADPFGVGAQIGDMQAMGELTARVMRPAIHRTAEEQSYWSVYMHARACGVDRQLLLHSQFIVAMTLVQPSLARLIMLLCRAEATRAGRTADFEIIDKEIRSLLRRGPDRWKRALIDRFGFSTLEEAVDWPVLERMWTTRNLMVHRGGWVDDTYRRHVATAPPVGMPLELSAADVFSAFDFVGGVRFGFLVAASSLTHPGIEQRFAGAHSHLAMEDLDAGRWWLAEGIARTARAFANEAEAAAVAQVNLWLARAGRLGGETVRSEVVGWEPPGTDPMFQVAKLLLLGENSAALVAIREVLDDGGISRRQLAKWPLFRPLRETGLLDDLL